MEKYLSRDFHGRRRRRRNEQKNKIKGNENLLKERAPLTKDFQYEDTSAKALSAWHMKEEINFDY